MNSRLSAPKPMPPWTESVPGPKSANAKGGMMHALAKIALKNALLAIPLAFLTATATGKAAGEEPKTVTIAETAEADVGLAVTKPLTGEVVDAEGKPVAGS